MAYILLIIGLISGGIIGFFVALRAQMQKNKEGLKDLEDLKVNHATLVNSNTRLSDDLELSKTEHTITRQQHQDELKKAIEWKSKYEALEDKIDTQKEELASLQEKFTKEFELVAAKILEEKSSKFTEQNKQNIDAILNPLKEKITEFQQKVEDSNEKSVERSAALNEHLTMLRKLNQGISDETRSLTNALRGDSKTQGGWGEMHLERILEKAGLEKGVHYSKETNLKTEDGDNQRLDYIIDLPDGKNLIIDSKVSLTAYANYSDAEDVEEQDNYLQQHLMSVSTHIKLLSGKDYHKLHGINSPDYVIMFIANEPALTLALKEDQTIFEKALDKNVVLVSTSTLLATLRTISYIWKQDKQNRNAEEIARQAASLYSKFVSFSEDLIKLGSQLKTVTGTYEESMKKLVSGKDNLIRKTERLKELGVNPSKSINQNLIDRSDSEME
ncbi:MAG: DNA recombination protein RmuC [Crocinitomicaceae bacterium]|jgi:DNA recombination protein RmuC